MSGSWPGCHNSGQKSNDDLNIFVHITQRQMLLDICGKHLNFTAKLFWHPGFKFQLCLPSLDPAQHFNFDCPKQNANSVK